MKKHLLIIIAFSLLAVSCTNKNGRYQAMPNGDKPPLVIDTQTGRIYFEPINVNKEEKYADYVRSSEE